MTSAEIRRRFLEYFRVRGHEVVPSSSLVPADDPTLLFTNAGMVQFKRVFLGQKEVPYDRAVTSQKCVRAGGKHNDLEEVGRTARHHTFFEMLGNFSFGDYFKRDAVDYAWDFLTGDLGLEPDRLFATVHHTDDEAHALWQEVAGLPAERVYRLGDEDNFWQMADTGPCGPCSELHYDMRPEEERRRVPVLPSEEFEAAGERGEFLELWNLVFMQFDRDEEGVMHPLPAPSIDTGAGLERLAVTLQDVDSNYHTDLFLPLLEAVGEVVGRPYEAEAAEGTSYRVLADHARAVAFLLCDGVFPSNEGRGYVLRRILRRGVRHAWLLGRRRPTLTALVPVVAREMGDAYPELRERIEHIERTTRAEEERFLSTIEEGMERFDELAPELPEKERQAVETGEAAAPVVPGEEAFRLYDTFGFPLDLTELMARERGYAVDVEGFEAALATQRERSRADHAAARGGDRTAAGRSVDRGELHEGWVELHDGAEQEFVGYTSTEVDTELLAFRVDDGWMGVQLRENPFYVESGGQVSDRGRVEGEGWSLDVDDVVQVGDRVALLGPAEGDLPGPGAEPPVAVHADVPSQVRRDTERNHTATHLLHAALREVLGEHVVQRGSLVAPDRLRFDFTHTAPLTPGELEEVERRVNAAVWSDHPVASERMAYDVALEGGAMALFGEKYGDEVRVVTVPGVSMELCGGTHVRHTGTIGLFKIVSETGVAAGVRRIEALTGPGAFRHLESYRERLREAAELLETSPDAVLRRAKGLLGELEELEELLRELREGGGGERVVREAEIERNGKRVIYRGVRLRARDADDVRSWGDAFLGSESTGVAVVAAELPDKTQSLFSFVTDDLIGEGIRADVVVRKVAAVVGGKGGGRPHMAQAGVGDPARLDEALERGEGIVRELMGEGADG